MGEIIGVILALALLVIVIRAVASGVGDAVAGLIARVQQRVFRRTLLGRIEPLDIAGSALATAIGVAAFLWVQTLISERVFPLPTLVAPFTGAPAPDAPARYADLLRGSAAERDRDRFGRLSSQAPPWPGIAAETLWIPVFTADANPARKAASGARLRGEQRLSCGFDRTATVAPTLCQFTIVAPVDAPRAPVVGLVFEPGGVSATATRPAEALALGAAPLTPVSGESVIGWSWSALGQDPAAFRSLRLRAEGETFAVDLGERALVAIEIVTTRRIGARRERDEEARRRLMIRAARGFQRLGDRAGCDNTHVFDFWRERTRPYWSSRLVFGAPDDVIGDAGAQRGAVGEPCVAAAFGLRFVAGLGAWP